MSANGRRGESRPAYSSSQGAERACTTAVARARAVRSVESSCTTPAPTTIPLRVSARRMCSQVGWSGPGSLNVKWISAAVGRLPPRTFWRTWKPYSCMARALEALLVAPFDQDVVAAQRRGNTVRSTAEHANDTQRRQRAPHGTTRLAPTKRVTHQAPSESSISRRDSFTPVLEL